MFINKSPDGRNNICGAKVALLRKAEGISQRELADRLSEKADDFAAVLFGENNSRYVIISKTDFNLGVLCKELNRTFSGRGGGRGGIVQGSLLSPDGTEKFLKEFKL